MQIISKHFFKCLLEKKLGDQFARAEKIFDAYGETQSANITNALIHAVDQEKVEEVFLELEKHWGECIQYNYPGCEGKSLKTWNFFAHLTTKVLGIDEKWIV